MKPDKNSQAIKEFITNQPSILWAILITITLFSTFVLYPDREKISYDYTAGDVAERDIKAPRDFFIEDINATLLNRQQVADSFRTIYDYDPNMAIQLSEKLDQAFAIPRKLFETETRLDAPALPQAQMTTPDGQTSVVNGVSAEQPSDQIEKQNNGNAEKDRSAKNGKSQPSLESAMGTLQEFETTLGISLGEKAYSILYKNSFNRDITDAIKSILVEILRKGVVSNKDLFLKEEKKGIIIRTLGLSNEQIVDSLRSFYGLEEAPSIVKSISEPFVKGMNRTLANTVLEISQKLIVPNITMNRSETEKRIKEAQSAIKPVLYQIKQGEMILREGERVDETDIVKLKALSHQLKQKNRVTIRTGTALIILFTLLVIYNLFLKNNKKIDKHHNKNILFLAMMLIIFLSLTKIAAPVTESSSMSLPLDITSRSIFLLLPLSAGAMTVSIFLGFEVALYFTVVLSILGAIIFSSSIDVFLFFFLSSISGAFWMKECRERKIFITSGFKLALFNAGLATVLCIHSAEISLRMLANNVMLATLSGFASGIITAGLTPVAELLFSYTTEIKFLELSNLDQPMMKRLMIEAPGTYNHSVIVSNLAEAAASAIGVNVLRTKVGAFYHDIGKLDKPLYFIENQTDGINRHDKISPSMSALVLIQHTKKGIEFAKEHKLGQEIIDIIQQHHGTSLIRYFYNKSVKIHGADAVKESDFRYPGPKPQTREAAIVMLADVVEAALRTLERPTSARIQGRVQELINAIFMDGQLEECELTLKDLHRIAKSFTTILTGLYHHRIEYTDTPPELVKENKAQ